MSKLIIYFGKFKLILDSNALTINYLSNYGGKMMKRTIGLVLSLVMLFASSKVTRATTTFLLGFNAGTHGEIEYSGINDSGKIEGNLISLTYVNKVKIVITNQFGEFYGNNGKEHMEFFDIQAGYPVVSDKSGILYLTLTGIDYSGCLNYFTPYLSEHEADGGLIGFEMVGFPTSKTQFEFGWHRAIGGSYRINNNNSKLDLTLLKLKVQYLLTDNLGLVIWCQIKEFDNKDYTMSFSEEINTAVIGLIYRL